MTNTYPFRCCICEEPIGNPHLSLDRRSEKLEVILHEGQPTTQVRISHSDAWLMYCSHACWQFHQDDLAAALDLKQIYPPAGFVTPCGRCGKPVDRTQPYVCLSLAELVLEGRDVLIGHCIDDNDFAVLCRECEWPDEPAAEAADEPIIEKEDARV